VAGEEELRRVVRVLFWFLVLGLTDNRHCLARGLKNEKCKMSNAKWTGGKDTGCWVRRLLIRLNGP